jgi:DNA-binding beta-propeller fold protein YncE
MVLAWGPSMPEAAADFVPGDLLVDEFGGSTVQRYRPDGALTQTFTGTGSRWEGASITPTGNLVTTFRSPSSGVDIFNPSGTQIASFGIATSGAPGAVSVFADGLLAINDQSGAIQEYRQDGTFVRTVKLADVNTPFGSTVGSDNVLYVAGAGSDVIGRVTEAGQVLSSIPLNFTPGDLVRAADGTFYVSGRSDDLVHHISATGLDLNDFSIGLGGAFDGIALAADGRSLYVTTESSTVVKQFDLTGKALAGGFTLDSPDTPLFLTVVPAAAVPEPSSVVLVAVGLGVGGLGAARRWRASARIGE